MEIKKKGQPTKKEFSWQTREYRYYKRSEEWFWIVGLAIVLGIILAIIAGNFLFAVIILVGGITVVMYAVRPPENLDVLIRESGIKINSIFFPFDNISAFSLQDNEEPFQLVIFPKNSWVYKSITLDLSEEIELGELKKFLSEKIEEKPYQKSLSEAFGEIAGF